MSNFLDSWATEMAKHTNFTSKDDQVYLYSMKVIAVNTFGFLTIALVSYFLGIFITTITAYIAAGTLRIFSGGYHADNTIKCAIIGLITFCGAGFISDNLGESLTHNQLVLILFFVLLFSAVSIYLFAPVETSNKPIKSSQVAYLKRLSIIVWGFWFITLSLNVFYGFLSMEIAFSILLGVLIQSLMLMPYQKLRKGGENR